MDKQAWKSVQWWGRAEEGGTKRKREGPIGKGRSQAEEGGTEQKRGPKQKGRQVEEGTAEQKREGPSGRGRGRVEEGGAAV